MNQSCCYPRLTSRIPLVVAGTGAEVTLPVVGQVVGTPALLYGGYQTVTGAARVVRAGRQFYGASQGSQTGCSVLDQLGRFIRGVLPVGGTHVWDWAGGLP